MFSIQRVLASVVCASLASAALVAQSPTPAKPPAVAPATAPAVAPAAPAQVFVVVRASDKLEVMHKDAVAAREQRLANEHAKAMQKYEKDRKAAAEAKQPFHQAVPKAVTLEVLPGEYATQALADAALKKLEAEAKARLEPKKDLRRFR